MNELWEMLSALFGAEKPPTSIDDLQPPAFDALRKDSESTAPAAEPALGSKLLDAMQAVGDVAGVIDQSGIIDGLNALLSGFRAATSQNDEERQRHIKDAGIRAVSMVPILGDFAKVARTGQYMDEVESLPALWEQLKPVPADQSQMTEKPETSPVDAAPLAEKSEAAPEHRVEQPPGETRKPSFWERNFPTFHSVSTKLTRSPESATPPEAANNDRTPLTQPPLEQFGGFSGMTGSGDEATYLMTQPPMLPPGNGGPPDNGSTAGGGDEGKEDSPAGAFKGLFKKLFSPVTDIVSGAMTGDLKKVAAGFAKLSASLVMLPTLISKFGESMVESLREFAKYDGATSAELAQTDLQKVHLDMQYARGTSESSVGFLEEMQEFREAYQPLREFGGNLTNELATVPIWIGKIAAQVANGVVELTSVKDILSWMFEWEKGKEKPEDSRGQEFLNIMGRDGFWGNDFNNGKRQPLKDL